MGKRGVRVRFSAYKNPGKNEYIIQTPCIFCGKDLEIRVDGLEMTMYQKIASLILKFPRHCPHCHQTNYYNDYKEFAREEFDLHDLLGALTGML